MYDIKMSSGLNAPCWMSETQKGGHKALPYIICCLYSSFEKKKTAHFRVRYMLALSTFLGRPTYCHAVRNSPVDCSRRKKRARLSSDSVCWRYLSSRVGQRIVLASQQSSGLLQPELIENKKRVKLRLDSSLCWRYLSSRAVARQVLSAQMSLTSVFGMGTGGPSLQSTPTI